MFTIINFKDRNDKSNITQNLKYYFSKNKIYLEKYKEFYVLNYNNYGRKIRWKKIIKRCPTEEVLFLQENSFPSSLKKRYNARIYSSKEYESYLLIETLGKILKEIKLNPIKKNLLFIDENANNCEFVTQIAQNCNRIYVLTKNIDKYTHLQRKLLKEIGLYLTICTKFPAKNDVILCIAFGDISCYNISLTDIPTFVILNKKQDKNFNTSINIAMNSPKSFCYENILPNNSDRLKVCGAVRYFNNETNYDYCEKFIFRNKIISFSDLLLILENNVQNKS